MQRKSTVIIETVQTLWGKGLYPANQPKGEIDKVTTSILIFPN